MEEVSPRSNTLREDETLPDTRVSPLAVVALLCGVASILALISSLFYVLCFAAIALGAIAYIGIQNHEELAGGRAAQVAILLGALTASWSITSSVNHNTYLYEQAAPMAEQYLSALAEERIYDAMEMRKIEPDRQLVGADLEAVYTEPDSDSARYLKELLEKPVTQWVIESGSKAQWQFARGVKVNSEPPMATVTIEMKNIAADHDQRVQVVLRRDLGLIVRDSGPQKALWNIMDAIPSEN